MSIDAAAQALATDTAMPAVDAPETVEVSEDAAMDALFDSLQEPDDQTADEQPETPEDAPDDSAEHEEEAEQEPSVEAPSDVPYAIKQHWKDIPETARDAILESQREMGRKLADQGRQVQGIAPIRDVLTRAVQDLPALANMKPEAAAEQIFELAKMSNDFTSNPVDTLMGYIKKHNLSVPMARALAGQPQTNQGAPELQNEIKRMNREIERISDPKYMREHLESFNNETQVHSSVQEFASTAKHWRAVEDHMPAAIQYVQATLSSDASPKDVLSKAYDLAVSQFVPDAKARTGVAADEAARPIDPERSKAAMKAKSVNVQSRSSGKARNMSEDELLSATFDKLQN